MADLTQKTIEKDKLIASNYATSIPSLKDRLYSVCDTLLPKTNYWDSTTDFGQPSDKHFGYGLKDYMCSREELLSDIEKIIDENVPITQDEVIEPTTVYNLIQQVFAELGRCKRTYIKQLNGTGSKTSPADLDVPIEYNVWVYYRKKFQFHSENIENGTDAHQRYTSDIEKLPTPLYNWNSDNYVYSSTPGGNTGWGNDSRYVSHPQQSEGMSVNNLIKAIDHVETQIANFSDELGIANRQSLQPSSPYWWNGSSVNPNGSNRIVFARYWCHNNCWCHHQSRSRR